MRRSTLLGPHSYRCATAGSNHSSASPRRRASITAVDVARRIGIIADDSMMGRDTPSRGLDLTAAVRGRPVSELRAEVVPSSGTPSPGGGWSRPTRE